MKHHIIIILLLTVFTFLTFKSCFHQQTSPIPSVFSDTPKVQSVVVNKVVIYPRIDTVYLVDSISTYTFSYRNDWMKLSRTIVKTTGIGNFFKDSTAYKKDFQTLVSLYNIHL